MGTNLFFLLQPIEPKQHMHKHISLQSSLNGVVFAQLSEIVVTELLNRA